MGCGRSKNLEDDYLLSHKVLCGVAYDKSIKVDFSFNPNKYIANNVKYYKEQTPGKGEFKDTRFPPDIDTFFGRKDGVYYDKTPRRRAKGMYAIKATEDIIEWRRARDIWGDDIRIFGETTSADDIDLGEVNDSYFVAAMAALSDFPALILQLFKTVKFPTDGSAIEVAVEIDGEWEIVCVDDYFPFNTETNKPIFSDSRTHNLWAVILEKVWAKVNYGYVNIVGGTPREVFETFTPFIITPINTKKENRVTLWENIKDASNYNCIMACTTTDDTNGLEKVGLKADENFYFVNAYDNDDKKSKGLKMMTLKYPFGPAPWKGEYSYKSERWRSANLRKTYPDFNPNGGQDGLFWIDYTNFCRYFRLLSLCIFLKPLISCVFKIEKDRADDFNAMKIRIEGEGILAINVFKKDYRFHRKIGPEEQVISNIILAKLDKDNKKLDYIDSSCDETMSCNVTRGEFVCLFNVDYTTAGVKMRKYAINISTSCKFHVCMIDSDNTHEVLKAIMIPRIESSQKYNLKFQNPIVHFTGNRFENTSIAFMYIKNQEESEIHYKATISYKNIASIDGELPVGLKLKVNDKFIFLGNRIKINEPYSLSSMGHKNITAISGEIEPRVDQDLIDNVFVETPYEDTRVNFEFDQPS